MNKKGLERGLVFIFSGFFIAMLFFVYFLSINHDIKKTTEPLEEDLEDIEAGTYLNSYFNSENVYGSFSDLIIDSYAKNDFTAFKSETTKYFSEIYGKQMGWKITLNKQEISDNYKGTKKIIEDNGVLPGVDRKPIRIELRVSYT